ncbi:MAG: LysM peptidoglycan-binding domain-containing protein [Elusimicrobiota bacterium]
MKKVWGVLTVVTLLTITSCYADFENAYLGARSTGFGQAGVSLALDPETVLYNPAGLFNLRGYGVSMGTQRLLTGLTDGSELIQDVLIGYLSLGNGGTLAVALHNYKLGQFYAEDTQTVGYAYGFRPWFWRYPVMIGMNVKLLTKRYFTDQYIIYEPLFKTYGLTKQGMECDFGMVTNYGEHVAVGFAVQNFVRTSLNFTGESTTPLIFRIGTSYHGDIITAAVDLVVKRLNVMVNAGGEYTPVLNNNIIFRAGLGVGTGEYLLASTGIGYKFGNMVVDYSFSYPLLTTGTNWGTHSVCVKMLAVPPKERAEKQFDRGEEKQVKQYNRKQIDAFIKQGKYVVAEGDTLPVIAEKVYGNRGLWRELYNANKERVKPSFELIPGQVLILPNSGEGGEKK